MAARFDPLFPQAGGMVHLDQVRQEFVTGLANKSERAPRTMFHPAEIAHLQKAFAGLGDDEVAKSTLMSYLAFAQMKSDVAG